MRARPIDRDRRECASILSPEEARDLEATTYAHLKEVYGCKPGVIAEELDLPIWLIEAWQCPLNRAERAE